MRTRGIMLMAAALLLCCSCKKQLKPEEITVIENDSSTTVTAVDSEGALATGEIWDEDHRFCQELKDGKLVKIFVLHENGVKAFDCRFDEKGSPQDRKFYNEKSEEITKEQFAKRYAVLIKKYGWAI